MAKRKTLKELKAEYKKAVAEMARLAKLADKAADAEYKAEEKALGLLSKIDNYNNPEDK